MILAAGAGTRLRPLTNRMPKALIEVGGRPLLAHVLERLVAAGAKRVIVNTHHHADQIGVFLERHAPPGVAIALSPEPDGPYGTGGGLLAAAPLFREDGPFLVHNVDVLSEIPLEDLLAEHVAARPPEGRRVVASLAVQDRPASRGLLFDAAGLLGWDNRKDGVVVASQHAREPAGEVVRRAFSGIHVVEPVLLEMCRRTDIFSIIDWYLDLAAQGHAILPIDVTSHAWLDVGTPERLAQAESGWPAS
ncbi:MAG: nucleotidyltransferase family protein [Gemmatimonadales bacterium]